ncbi:type I-E CRISPR-associated protein Cas5/CasD [Oecophyllibacter saccharovorans]|nr:type I-E CRISPR-associated protein Cas5/CasD [Oecophyllibacter saccharovorans]
MGEGCRHFAGACQRTQLMRFLALNLQAPLASFGGTTVDHYGITRLFPAASMLTGLLGNALGYQRSEAEKLMELQERLIFGAFYRETYPEQIRDYQTVQLRGETSWTTDGTRAERKGASGDSTHIRYRDYLTDLDLYVVLALTAAEKSPTLDNLVQALEQPARPLSLGRKTCLPSEPLLLPPALRFQEAATPAEAALNLARALPFRKREKEAEAKKYNRNVSPAIHLMRPALPAERALTDTRALPPAGLATITDERNWQGGFHGGSRQIVIEKLPINTESIEKEIPIGISGEPT